MRDELDERIKGLIIEKYGIEGAEKVYPAMKKIKSAITNLLVAAQDLEEVTPDYASTIGKATGALIGAASGLLEDE
jgi:hypothetical protein